jgi:hypothetical protein
LKKIEREEEEERREGRESQRQIDIRNERKEESLR